MRTTAEMVRDCVQGSKEEFEITQEEVTHLTAEAPVHYWWTGTAPRTFMGRRLRIVTALSHEKQRNSAGIVRDSEA
jgi:hypothetical protein